MALSQSKDRVVVNKNSLVRNFDVRAGINVYEGAVVGIDGGSGFAGPFSLATYNRVLGVAYNQVEALAVDSSDRPLAVEIYQLEQFDLSGMGIDASDVGKGIYSATNDDDFQLAVVPAQLFGVLYQFISGTLFWINVTGPNV